MKRLLLFAISAMVSMTSFAQEEDVTNLIQNAGFDEDLTWQADGSKKATIGTQELSNRSIAAWAEDSTVYATVNPSTPKTRPDGRTLEATNGFKGRIKGWTLDTNGDFPGCEWTYFGSLPYSLGETAIPIADDGNTYLTVPAKPEDFNTDDNLGFVYMRAGWGGRATYKQTVKLPCAKYRLEYWSININPNGTNGKNLSKVTCRTDTWPDETGFSATEWTKHEIEFIPTAEFSIELGFESSGGSGSNPFLCVDGIKLYKIDEATTYDIFSSELYELQQEAATEELMPLVLCMDEYMSTMETMLDEDEAAAIPQIEKRLEEFRWAIAEAKNINSLLRKMDYVLQITPNYPGQADFEAAIAKISGYVTGQGEEGADVVAQILGAQAEAKEAMKAYFLSKVDTATPEDPAELTVFVKNPWFINEDAEPMLNEGVLEFPKQFSEEGEDLYKEGSASSPDLNSEGWYVAGISGGDQRLNWQRGRSCWNAWNNNFTGTIAVAQDIYGLPNGYYTVSADLITQSGYATDQHVFAQSTIGKNISNSLTTEGWDENLWETISMTADQKVLVVDGKLTIGAEGTGTGSGSAGWFLATNFKLNFVGKASQEEIDKAINANFDATVKAANEYAATMHFAADKKALLDIVALYKDGDKIAAIEKINAAIEEAKMSEAKYFDYLPTPAPEDISGKTLLWVKAVLDGEYVDGRIILEASKPIVQFAYDYVMTWIACDTATYTKFDETVELLKNYANTYAPVYEDANAQLNILRSEKAKKELRAIMDQQKVIMTAAMNAKERIDALVADLLTVMSEANKQEIFENNQGATDYTAFIQNPNLEAETGWEFNTGNGNTNTTSGQWFDGSGTRYIDSYNSGGLSGYIASQLVTGLPNGTYKVGAYVRTPAEGAYIYADNTFVEIPLSCHQTIDEETGEDIYVIASDKWGELWEEAKAIIEDEARYYALSYDEQTYYENIFNANNGEGRGWKYMEIANIVVKDHQMMIGAACGSEALGTPKVFAGSWFSVGGWTLTLTAMGDNTGWDGPMSEVTGGKMGDVNHDDAIDVTDAVLIIDEILMKNPANFDASLADVNGDGDIDVTDVVMVIDAILGKIELSRGATRAEKDLTAYTAFQMDLTIPSGYVLEGVELTEMAKDSHKLAYSKLADGICRVVVFSMDNEALPGAWDEVIRLNLRGQGDATVNVDRAMFVTVGGERHELLINGTTSIAQFSTLNSQFSIVYDLTGRKVQKTAKGVYIENGRKVVK